MFCTKCGEELSDGMKFCTACGTKVELVEPEDLSASETVRLEPVESTSEVTEPIPEVHSCSSCGAQLEEGMKFCTACGAPVIATTAAASVVAANVTEALPESAFMPQTPEPLTAVAVPAVTDERKKNGSVLRGVIIGVVCAAVVLGIAALFLLIQGASSDVTADKEPSSKSAQVASSSASAESTTDESASEAEQQDAGTQEENATSGTASGGNGARLGGATSAPQQSQPAQQTDPAASQDNDHPEVIFNDDGSETYRYPNGTEITVTPQEDSSDDAPTLSVTVA